MEDGWQNNSLKIMCFVILLMTEILGGIKFSGQQIEKCVILTMMTMKWAPVFRSLEVRKIECQYPRRPNSDKI